MATSAAIEQMFAMDGHVVSRRKANSKSLSVKYILFFDSVLKAEKEALKVD